GAPARELLASSHSAFIHGMDVTVLTAAGVALLGALLALVFLPARAAQQAPAPAPIADAEGEPAAQIPVA
ncbi:MAG TPA: MFS transporter, partial [Actinomycetota bacterium]